MGTSTFAEATVMPEIALAKLDPDAPLGVICTLACGATAGIGAALYIAEVEPAPPAWCSAPGWWAWAPWRAVASRARTASSRVDLSEERLEHATAQGATGTLVGGPDTVAKILDMTGGLGADYTFEATGLVGVMRQAIESARMGWGLCTIAGVAGRGEVLEVVPRFLITGRRIAGASFGGAKGRDCVPELVDLYTAGDLDLESLVTRRVQLDQVNDAFEAMEGQDGIRTVITY
jgi:S-(hydroxymethyl)glutathione dehydrogenase / alcohol dehydrogenase